MAGNAIGGRKAAEKNQASDPDFYKKIGQRGGRAPNKTPKGFAANRERARIAGAKGGATSRRGKAVTTLVEGSIVTVRGNTMSHRFPIGEQIRVTKPGPDSFRGEFLDGHDYWYVANKDVTVETAL